MWSLKTVREDVETAWVAGALGCLRRWLSRGREGWVLLGKGMAGMCGQAWCLHIVSGSFKSTFCVDWGQSYLESPLVTQASHLTFWISLMIYTWFQCCLTLSGETEQYCLFLKGCCRQLYTCVLEVHCGIAKMWRDLSRTKHQLQQ